MHLDIVEIPHEIKKVSLTIPGWDYLSILTELDHIYEPNNPLDDRLITNPLAPHGKEWNGAELIYKLWKLYPDPWQMITDTITHTVGMIEGYDVVCESLTTSIMEPGDFTIPHFHSGQIHAIWYLSDDVMDDLELYSLSNSEFIPIKSIPVTSGDLIVFSGNMAHGTTDLLHKRLLLALTFYKKNFK